MERTRTFMRGGDLPRDFLEPLNRAISPKPDPSQLTPSVAYLLPAKAHREDQ